jgi:hypothetical protein
LAGVSLRPADQSPSTGRPRAAAGALADPDGADIVALAREFGIIGLSRTNTP